jgi:trigger factor
VKVTTEELERCEVLMTVEIEGKQEQDLLKKAAKRIAREVRIPGFRPGKAPYNVVVRRFGLEAIQQEVLEQSLDKMVQDALKEINVQPFAQIKLEGVAWDPLTIKIIIPTEPHVKLGDYRNIRLEYEAVKVNKEDITKTLEDLQERHATWAPVERPAEVGDLITISVVEKDGDKVIAEQASVEHELITMAEAAEDGEKERQFRIDLTTPLLGLAAADEKSFSIDYPEEFDDERYAGKTITFEVKVISVKEKELDPLDDDFAKLVSDFDTLAELEADIEKRIMAQRERQQRHELGEQALEKLLAESKTEWPLAFEEESLEQEIKAFERRIQDYGFNLDNYLRMENKTKGTFQDEVRERVVNGLRRNLVLSEIAELEKIEVSESEILERAKLISDVSGQGDQLWRGILGSQAHQNLIASELLVEKVLQWLGAVAKGEEPAPAEETETTAEADTLETATAVSQVDNHEPGSPVASEPGHPAAQESEGEVSPASVAHSESAEEPVTAEIKS